MPMTFPCEAFSQGVLTALGAIVCHSRNNSQSDSLKNQHTCKSRKTHHVETCPWTYVKSKNDVWTALQVPLIPYEHLAVLSQKSYLTRGIKQRHVDDSRGIQDGTACLPSCGIFMHMMMNALSKHAVKNPSWTELPQMRYHVRFQKSRKRSIFIASVMNFFKRTFMTLICSTSYNYAASYLLRRNCHSPCWKCSHSKQNSGLPFVQHQLSVVNRLNLIAEPNPTSICVKV